MMFIAYTFIWLKLKKASKAFPYLSQPSRIARSRQKVINMLFLLIIVELICWGPWQFFILTEYVMHNYFDKRPDVSLKNFLDIIDIIQNSKKQIV